MLPQPGLHQATGSLGHRAEGGAPEGIQGGIQGGTHWGMDWIAAMRAGDWEAAWRVNDHVLALRDPATADDPTLPYHLRWVWNGTPPDGLPTLVRCYHGLGDTVQFARYLPLLRERAGRVTLEVQPELAGLLAAVPGADEVVPFQLDAPLPAAPCTLEIMELPHALRVPPPPAPYLGAPPGAPPNSGPLRVGLCWQAGNWNPARSVPLALLGPLGRLPGVALVSLQRGAAAEEVLAPGAPPFLNPRDRSLDAAETARLIMGLHLVVTVDTLVAHLAGALGRPGWVLLRRDADWRWPPAAAASPWYPSLRLARQDEEGDWMRPVADVIEAVAAEAARLARARRARVGL
jgi:hypothetical protein